MSRGWQELPAARTPGFAAARDLIHHALQVPAAVGAALGQPRADFDHHAMRLDVARGLCLGAATPAGTRAALDPRGPAVCLVGSDGAVRARFDLAGRTRQEGLAWLAAELRSELADAGEELCFAGYELPEHPAGRGAPFQRPDPAGLEELLLWLTDGHAVLRAVRSGFATASDVRLWPHHFDQAVLIPIDEDVQGETARSVGAGLAPGSGPEGEPYAYVLPWPPPDPEALPAFGPPGGWHRQGWIGLELGAGELTRGSGPEQERRVAAFLREGVAAARALLGAE